ncbi:MAG: hypothetical protein Q4C99_06630 [Clostridia bacterium]|nr:hypothetical protein [Clostridia bacterium]
MKKTQRISLFLILLVIFGAVFGGCSNNSNDIMMYNSKEYVDLFNYSDLEVNRDFIKVSQDDINQIIETEMSSSQTYIEVLDRTSVNKEDILLLSIDGEEEYYILGTDDYGENFDNQLLSANTGDELNAQIDNQDYKVKILGIYRYVTVNDRDYILKYYGYEDYNELISFLEKRAQNEILFNYVVQKVEENSTIKKYPKEIEQQIEKTLSDTENEIKKYYSSVDEYCTENDISKEDFENGIAYNYQELMIYKAILDNENQKITDEDISDYANDDTDEYVAYFDACENKLRQILPQKVRIKN